MPHLSISGSRLLDSSWCITLVGHHLGKISSSTTLCHSTSLNGRLWNPTPLGTSTTMGFDVFPISVCELPQLRNVAQVWRLQFILLILVTLCVSLVMICLLDSSALLQICWSPFCTQLSNEADRNAYLC